MGGRGSGAYQRQSGACDVLWCDEVEGGHADGQHVAYLVSEIVEGVHPGGPCTLQVLLVGHDEDHPRPAVVLVPAAGLRHVSVVLSERHLTRVRDALDAAHTRLTTLV
ncbi:hypothetical protein CLV30_11769 [Haloactinopolyspora alba]|uniref:Uncharacterized protein n=2 Tax=Haloactinopolyspora alba TaxID=648780 RepID=A0A2P8DRC3_9ACTN|nr:hypothetical protein CLV30_11769 [Haloactinopolyspora alba]